jgi:bla regulator protein blaR1
MTKVFMTTEILNHLLQSTAFAAVCALLTLAVRNNRAHIRYGLWVAASLKFLVPFGALIALGRALGQKLLPPTAGRSIDIVLEMVALPLSRTVVQGESRVPVFLASGASTTIALPEVIATVWAVGCILLLARWAVQWRAVARVAASSVALTEGREVAILRRLERARGSRSLLTMVVARGAMEPGVFGFVRPRLLWPGGISERLDDAQIEAILSHELSHVARHDNLIAALQMAIESLFWFHPVVWWIGRRLVTERERACDEDVLGEGSEPGVYAESILRTCRFAIESPLPYVAGVTGADLKQRIETIMTHRGSEGLGMAKRVLLASVGLAAMAGPIAVGVVHAPRLRAETEGLRIGEQKFEVAAVKPNKSGDGPSRIALAPGGRITVENLSLQALIRFAFQMQPFQIVGGPEWIGKDRFDVTAKGEGDIPPAPIGTTGPGQLMMRSLLADRFKLIVHLEQRELPVYVLAVARSDGRLGPQLKPSTTNCQALMAANRGRGGPPPAPMPNGAPPCGMRVAPGAVLGGGFPITQLATTLSQLVGRSVVDRTGLSGEYDIELKFAPDQMPIGLPPKLDVPLPPLDPNGPSIFTALQEQLGLKLESSKDAVDVLVIDHAEPPTPD